MTTRASDQQAREQNTRTTTAGSARNGAIACALVAACAGCTGGEPWDRSEALNTAEEDLYGVIATYWTKDPTTGLYEVPVCWLNANRPTEQQWVRDQIESDWSGHTLVNFSGWNQCDANTPEVGIKIKVENSNYTGQSQVGRTAGNPSMWLNFDFSYVTLPGSNCYGTGREFCIREIALHEFGHALSFLHEQNRPDANGGDAGASPGNEYIGAYDPDSVMDYGHVSVNALSDEDAAGIKQIYEDPLFTEIVPNHFDKLKGDFTNVIVGDYDGDGDSDFIRQEKGAWDDDGIENAQLVTSNGDGSFYYSVIAWQSKLKGDRANLIPGDFNGDGMTDILRQEKGAWDDDAIDTAHVGFSLGDGSAGYTWAVPIGFDRLKGDYTLLTAGDFNADGKTDFLRQEYSTWDDDSTTTAEVWLSVGDGSFNVILPTGYDQLKGDYTNVIPGDFNDDGKTDFLRQEKGLWDDDAVNTASVWLSTGDGQFTIVAPENFDQLKGDYTNLIPGDFNGDGRTDVLRQEKSAYDDDAVNTAAVWFSDGDGTFTVVEASNKNDMKGDQTLLTPGDFNGDGKTDLLRQEKGTADDDGHGNFSVLLSRGDGSFKWLIPTGFDELKGDETILTVGDFDGDGRDDFLRREYGAADDDAVNTADFYLSPFDYTFREFFATATADATQATVARAFTAGAGETIIAATCGFPGAIGYGDTTLRVVDAAGVEVASNDDASGCGALSSLTYTVPSAGTYQVRIGCKGATSCSGSLYFARHLARGMTATQSSTYSVATANRAVDGNTDGVYSHDSVTHTNSELNAYWQVDLGASKSIDHIRLWNRTDSWSSRLSNFDIMVCDDDDCSEPSYTYHRAPAVSTKFFLATEGVTGRYVRVQLSGTNNLSLAEVEVLGEN